MASGVHRIWLRTRAQFMLDWKVGESSEESSTSHLIFFLVAEQGILAQCISEWVITNTQIESFSAIVPYSPTSICLSNQALFTAIHF